MRYARSARLAPAAVVVLFAGACAGDPEGTLSITTGEELDAFSRAPAPTSLVVEAVDVAGGRRELARTPLPDDHLALGELPRSDVGAIAVTGLDAAGLPVLRGQTLFLQWGALEDLTLEVFVQRTGELARVPRGPAAIDATWSTVVVGRYLLATAGTTISLYDLLNLRMLEGSPALPRTAASLAVVDTTALLVDAAGATAFDLQTGQKGDVDPPAGATFAEIAGGATVLAPDGVQYIVGPTRRGGGPTTRIFRLDVDGKLTAVALANAREGACAAWASGRGLVVYGGSETAPGAEVLAPGALAAAPLPLPPDPIRGCGATALDASHVLVAGAEARVVDLACAAECRPLPWPGALGLVRAEAMTLGADAALVVGDDAAGQTKVFRVASAGPREVPTKNPRRGARLVGLPQPGTFAVTGGGAPGIEQYLE